MLENIPCVSIYVHTNMGWHSETSCQYVTFLRNSICMNICAQSHMWQHSSVSLVWRLCLAMARCLYILTYEYARKYHTNKELCTYQHMPVLRNITCLNMRGPAFSNVPCVNISSHIWLCHVCMHSCLHQHVTMLGNVIHGNLHMNMCSEMSHWCMMTYRNISHVNKCFQTYMYQCSPVSCT